MTKILMIKESLSGVGGYDVYHDGMASPYHIYKGMRKTPLALSLKSAADEWLKSNKAVTAEVVKQEMESTSNNFAELAEKRKDAQVKAEAERQEKLIEEIVTRFGLEEKPKK